MAWRSQGLLLGGQLPGLWGVLFDERHVWWQRRRTPCSGAPGGPRLDRTRERGSEAA